MAADVIIKRTIRTYITVRWITFALSAAGLVLTFIGPKAAWLIVFTVSCIGLGWLFGYRYVAQRVYAAVEQLAEQETGHG